MYFLACVEIKTIIIIIIIIVIIIIIIIIIINRAKKINHFNIVKIVNNYC